MRTGGIFSYIKILKPCFQIVSTQNKGLRTMVYVYSAKLQRRFEFEESIMDFMSLGDETVVKIKQNSGDLVVDDLTSGIDGTNIPFRRPRVCPFAARNRRFTDSDVLSSSRKWIPVACSCLLHISGLDGLFLTRRPWHMRSYPGVWVPPGGHCESGEPIQDTAFRELTEELGLHSLSENGRDIGSECSIEPLCAWEAAYPSRSDTVVGKQAVIPNSHHMVIYYSINWSSLSRPVSSLNDIHLHLPRFNLEVDEVSAVVWLPRSVLVKLSSDWEAFEKYFQNQSTTSASGYTYPELSTMPSTVQIDVDQTPVWYWSINSTEWQWIPVNQLICGLTSNRNPSINPELITQSEMKRQPSAVTLGTLYAISRWLASTTTG